jgi:hypothetical protein
MQQRKDQTLAKDTCSGKKLDCSRQNKIIQTEHLSDAI